LLCLFWVTIGQGPGQHTFWIDKQQPHTKQHVLLLSMYALDLQLLLCTYNTSLLQP
jgi:hypothetical protein